MNESILPYTTGMAWMIDVVVGLIILCCLFIGYRKGFVQKIANFISVIASFIIAHILSFKLAGILFDIFIGRRLITQIDDVARNMNLSNLATVQNARSITDGGISTLLRVLSENAPFGVGKIIEDVQTNAGALSLLQTADAVANETVGALLVNTLVRPMVTMFIAPFVFVVVFIIVLIIVKRICAALGIVNKIPLIGGANKALGGVLGLVEGVVVSFILMTVVNFIIPITGGDIFGLTLHEVTDTIAYKGYQLITPTNVSAVIDLAKNPFGGR
jgi:uncharacterized membrane protein required for colicin V production